ncbi:MAG: LacI family DNA-binding transcriptional regulator [Phycisphaerae bacterium]|nr:LacI family DNA-binding transcriptional regulator [Phycisphaerae bacterium]
MQNVSLETRKKRALQSGKLLVDWMEDELRRQVTDLSKARTSKLPHERTLAKAHNVSIDTVRAALARLKKERLLKSIPGKGTFILPATQRTGQVLIVSVNPFHPYNVMAGGVISSVLQEQGYAPNMLMRDNPVEELEHLGPLENLLGVMLIGAPSNEYIQAVMRHVDVPVVCIGDINQPVRPTAICDNVLTSNQGLGFAATEYLIHQGHTNIALGMWGLHSAFGRDHVFGYQQAMEKHNLPVHEEWCVEFPSVPFAQPDKENLYHQPLKGDLQKQIDRWFAPGAKKAHPTALIHNTASELQVRDLVHYYFHDHFAPEAVVAAIIAEYLPVAYNGMGSAQAVCIRFENLARRALELLRRPRPKSDPPIREFHEQIYIYRRTGVAWELLKPSPAE